MTLVPPRRSDLCDTATQRKSSTTVRIALGQSMSITHKNQRLHLIVHLNPKKSAEFDRLHLECRATQRLRHVDCNLHPGMLNKMLEELFLVQKADGSGDLGVDIIPRRSRV